MLHSLREAHIVRKAIEVELDAAGTSAIGTLSLSIDDEDIRDKADVERIVEKAASQTSLRIARFERLNGILEGIRVAVANANVQEVSPTGTDSTSMSAVLTRISGVDRLVKLNRRVVAAGSASASVAFGRLSSLRRAAQSTEASYCERDVSVTPVDVRMVESAKDALIELTRSRRKLDDMRIAINATLKIEIADGDIEFLREERII